MTKTDPIFGYAVPLSLLVFASGLACVAWPAEPAQWQQASRNGRYELTLKPLSGLVTIGTLQDWILVVKRPNGGVVFPATITVGGGMRAHGHGLPTQPQIVRYGGDGNYLVEGVRFSMEGTWQLSFVVQSDAGADRADFTIEVAFPTPDDAKGEVETWSARERQILKSLRLPAAAEPPADPSNRFSGNGAAIDLGRLLFFDPRLSGDGRFACSSCHQPDRYYTDGLARSRGAGKVMRNAPTVVGAAFNRWFYWDGRRDSLWSQALVPFEAAGEMGGSRLHVVRSIYAVDSLREMYESIFGPLPAALLDREWPEHAGPLADVEIRDNWLALPAERQRRINGVYANLGKAIAAFETTLMPPRTRFDRYVDALTNGLPLTAESRLNADEIAGARLFMDQGRTQCLQCHNGMMLTNGDFHNIGSGNFSGDNLDYGRVFGLRAVLLDEFNCLGPHSDADPNQCRALRFLNRDSHVPLEGAFKVPSLRGLAHTAPYFHDGRFRTLHQVLTHYVDPPDTGVIGPHELNPLDLSDAELGQLEQFLLTFSQ